MAETAVGLAINRLDSLLTEEVKLLRHVRGELEDLKGELETINSLLRDADARFYQENEDSRVKTWVKQVRQIAFHIEDIIDEYLLYNAWYQNSHGCYKLASFLKKMKARHDIASRIQDIKKSIGQVNERKDRYSLNFSTDEKAGSDKKDSWHDLRLHSLFVEEAELVGVESPRAELISKLVEGTTKHAAISVVGMGGLGKTTLAKKVYDFESVTAHFDCKAWITVSQTYRNEELLRSMIRQFQRENMQPAFEGNDTVSELLLIEKLREYSSDKKYLVVFDDVWEIGFWEYIKTALPDNDKGSRIIITTRNEAVAPSPNASSCYHVHKLQPLSEIQAYDLFCNKVYQANGGKCPSELQELSHAIVEKCEGLPLAIVTIGGLLATKEKTVSEWKKFYDGLSSSLSSDQRLSSITKILSLSYHDLPYYLKSCLLHLSQFPEDYSIKCLRVIRLWIAEGFIRERQGKTSEDVAEDYLNELIHRSLIQVRRVNAEGKARECRVHDLIREIIIYRSRELGFHQISLENYQIFKGKSRHLSIVDQVKYLSESSSGDAQPHSTILFVKSEMPKSLISSLVKDFKLLRSLDFERASLNSLPMELGNLWHLRYLSLKFTKVKTLPKSIGKLCNLETLDLRESHVYDLPIEINKLIKLRHLLAYCCNYDVDLNPNTRCGVKVHGSIGCLKALQKLGYIEVDHDIGLIREVGKLIQLQKLQIKKLKRERGMDLCSALEKMTYLRTLLVSSVDEEEILDLQSLSDPPPMLQHLCLFGPLVNNELPHWIPKLVGRVKIRLGWSRLGDDAIEFLQALPNLRQLWIYEGYNGKQLHFKKECFQKLKILSLQQLIGLNEVIIDEGALPVLEELHFGPYPQLKELPSGIQFLRNLKKLDFIDIQRGFAIGMQPNGGHDYWKVEHIPLVLFWYKIKGVIFDSYKLGDLNLLKLLSEVS